MFSPLHPRCGGLNTVEDGDDYDFTEFRTTDIPLLREALPGADIAVSFAICEPRDGDVALRELALGHTTPAIFNPVDV